MRDSTPLLRKASGSATGNAREVLDAATAGPSAGTSPHAGEIGRLIGDVSDVRYYPGRDEALHAIGARAAYYDGKLVAGSNLDKEVEAHELIHHRQSKLAGSSSGVLGKSAVSQPGDAAEREADEGARAVLAGRAFEARVPAGDGIHRYIEASDGSGAKWGSNYETVLIGDAGPDQELWATKAKLEESERELAKSREPGLGWVLLVPTGQADVDFTGQTQEDGTVLNGKRTFYRAAPKWQAGRRRDDKLDKVNRPGGKDSDDQVTGTDTDRMALYGDCGTAAQHIMGGGLQGMTVVLPRGISDEGEEGMAVGGASRLDPRYGVDFAQRILLYRFMLDPDNFKYLVPDVHYIPAVAEQRRRGLARVFKGKIKVRGRDMEIIKPTSNDPSLPTHHHTLYAQLQDGGQAAFDSYMERMGAYGETNPEIGQAYVSMPDAKDNKAGWTPVKKQTTDKEYIKTWRHHWATVVMKDGSDNITLENEATAARGNDDVNRKWFLRMYGTRLREQTFLHKQASTGTFGNKVVAVAISPKHRNPENVKMPK